MGGDASQIDSGLYEENPASLTEPGKSLIRNQDTGDNADDFSEGDPDFKNSSFSANSEQTLQFEITVIDANPIIDNITITDDDPSQSGIQISPVPGGNKSVVIEVIVTDNEGAADISSVIATIKGDDFSLSFDSEINSTSRKYVGSFTMFYHDNPQTYNITVQAIDNAGNTKERYSGFEYMSILAIEIDTTAISVNASPGSFVEINGDVDIRTTDKPTIKNIGNTLVDLGFIGNNLVSGSNNIAVSNINYTVNGVSKILTNSMEVVSIDMPSSSLAKVDFSLFLPETTKAGNYIGETTIVAIAS